MPALAVYLEAEQGFGRHLNNLGRWDLVAREALSGYGATSTWGVGATVTTHDGMPVWDRGVALDVASQPIYTGAELVDLGAKISSWSTSDASNWGRAIRLASDTTAEWQWFKKFLSTVRGRQVAFLLPTNRPDMLPVGDASSGTLVITGADYVNDWYPSLAHRRVKLTKADGSIAYRTVTACSDNGNGTQNLTLAAAATGALARIEFLETVRFATDAISVTWRDATFESSPMATVVQQ